MKESDMFIIATENKFKMAAVAILVLVLWHNFGDDQNFCTKFGTVMGDEQLKVTHESYIWFMRFKQLKGVT